MATHPFVSMIRSNYPRAVESYCDNQVVLRITLGKSKIGKEDIYITCHCLGDEDDTVAILFEVTNRYSIRGVRHRKYIEKLNSLLNVNNIGVDIEFKPPKTTQFSMAIGKSSFDEFSGWDDCVVTNMVDYLIGVSSEILITMTLVTHLNSRLPNRGGTDGYRKLLPSHLAALTICSLGENSLMN